MDASLLVAHLVGDFLLQNDWMALNKKKSSWACLIHAWAYLLPFLLVPKLGPVQLGLIGLQHFLQDRTQFVAWFMRATGSAGFAKEPFAPWSLIITDNALHLAWIWAVVRWA